MTRATRAGLIKCAVLVGANDSATAGIVTAAQDGTAISTDDILIAVLELKDSTNAWADITSTTDIIAGGKITCPDSADDNIFVLWMATNAGLQVSSPFIAAGVGVGAVGNTAIAITGIEESDVIIAAIQIDTTDGLWTDRTDNTTISDDGEVKCSDSTNTDDLFVIWMDLTGPRGFSAVNLQFGIATLDSSPSSNPSSATLTDIKAEDTILVALIADETDYDAMQEVASVVSVTSDGVIAVDEPDPATTATAGSKIFCIWQKANDLDT